MGKGLTMRFTREIVSGITVAAITVDIVAQRPPFVAYLAKITIDIGPIGEPARDKYTYATFDDDRIKIAERIYCFASTISGEVGIDLLSAVDNGFRTT